MLTIRWLIRFATAQHEKVRAIIASPPEFRYHRPDFCFLS
jgi:hypothetical protein